MPTVSEHYEDLLADHYSWLFGGFSAKSEENRIFFEKNGIKPAKSGLALDLGAGSGFQAVPLARLGYTVTAIDLSDKLLSELRTHTKGLAVRTIADDMLNFPAHCNGPVEVCVCMGDTLTHLESKDRIHELFRLVHKTLEKNGRFVLTFRDLSSELKDLDRFIPVRSEDNKIFTCFLEYETEHVKVHDLLYEKKGAEWLLRKSFYRKCRISFEWTKSALKEIGFEPVHADVTRGLITIIAAK